MVAPKKRVLIVTKNETKTPKANLKKISPYKKDNTYRYIKNAAIATTAVAATAGLYKLYQDAQKDKKEGVEVIDNTLRLESPDLVNAREEQEKAVLQAQAALEAKEAERIANEKAAEAQAALEAKEAERIANEKAALKAKEAERIADEISTADRLQKEQQIMKEAQALEAETKRLEGMAVIEKAKAEDAAAEKTRIEAEEAKIEAAKMQKLADEKVAQAKKLADAAQAELIRRQTQDVENKRKEEEKQRNIIRLEEERRKQREMEQQKQREQEENERKRKEKYEQTNKDIEELYLEYSKMGFNRDKPKPNQQYKIYQDFIKFSEHREQDCLVTKGKCPQCKESQFFQACLSKVLNDKNVDISKIIGIMNKLGYDVTEFGDYFKDQQYRKDPSTDNLHLHYNIMRAIGKKYT
jgi:hypothetical protein